jgi:drug/metabolite transporter (DMT)-like permease
MLRPDKQNTTEQNNDLMNEESFPKRMRWQIHICQAKTNFVFQVTSVTLYLCTWVANGIFLQGITTGFGDKKKAYNKPAAITWFSYNFMILSLAIVSCFLTSDDKKTKNQKQSLKTFFCNNWAGRLGPIKAVRTCVLVSYTLLVLNVFMVLGLECISVTLSNAVYQIQTPLTLLVSVYCLQRREQWVLAEIIGIAISLVGILLIVLPPLLLGQDDEINLKGKETSCFVSASPSASMLAGVLVTAASAIIGGIYLVFWRIFSEQKEKCPLEGKNEFIDTHMTLAVIGLCNFLAGWPILVVLHLFKLEEFLLPQNGKIWRLLIFNGFVEYFFDATCAVAIYMTSPLIVAVVAPLTIPLSLIVDKQMYNMSIGIEKYPWCLSIGVITILGGTVLLESKPEIFNKKVGTFNNKKDSYDAEARPYGYK